MNLGESCGAGGVDVVGNIGGDDARTDGSEVVVFRAGFLQCSVQGIKSGSVFAVIASIFVVDPNFAKLRAWDIRMMRHILQGLIRLDQFGPND